MATIDESETQLDKTAAVCNKRILCVAAPLAPFPFKPTEIMVSEVDPVKGTLERVLDKIEVAG